MNVLVTGAGGFIGRHLCTALARAGMVPIALGRPSSAARRQVADFISVDGVPDQEILRSVVRRLSPTRVYHLAGAVQAESIEALYELNVFYGVRLLEACASLSAPPRIIMAGSAAEYGRPLGEGRLLSEADVPRPLTAYGISKLAQTCHALAQHDIPVTVARMFNPIGEGMPPGSAAGRFVDEISKLGPHGGVVETGPLHAARDLADVTEVVRALVALGDSSVDCGLYNVCTGHAMPIRAITETLTALAPFPVGFREARGECGVDVAVGDPSRLAGQGLQLARPDLVAVLSRMLRFSGVEVPA